MHGLGVAGLGGGDVEPARGVEVLLDPDALLVEAAEAELRRHEALAGGALEPGRGLGKILRNAAAFGEARRDLELGGGVAVGGGGAQAAAADAGGQPVGAGAARAGARGCGQRRRRGRRHDGGLRRPAGGSSRWRRGRRWRRPAASMRGIADRRTAFGEIANAGRQRDRLAIRRRRRRRPAGARPRGTVSSRAACVVVGSAAGVAPNQNRVGHEVQRAEHEQDDAGADQQLADLPAELAGQRFAGVAAGGVGGALVLRRRRFDDGGLGGAAGGGDEIRLAAGIGNDRRPDVFERRFGGGDALGGRIAAASGRRPVRADGRAAGWGRSGAAPAAGDGFARGAAGVSAADGSRNMAACVGATGGLGGDVRKRQGRLGRRQAPSPSARWRAACPDARAPGCWRRAAAGCRGCRPRWSPAGRPRGRACRARFRANPGCAGRRA